MLLAISVSILLLGFGEVKLQRIYQDGDERHMCPCSLNTVSRRAVGEQDAPNATFPYPGYFTIGYDYWIQCGATLITDRHLLIAAHCVYDYNIDNHGRWNQFYIPVYMPKVQHLDSNLLINHIKKITIHPDFRNYKEYNDYDYKNDIAIVELMGKVPWIHGIRAAVLPSPRLQLSHGTTVSECGWGFLDKELLRYSNSTQCAEMSVVENGQCQLSLGTPVESSMLCAGGVKRHSPCNFRGPCLGELPCMNDIGGGLLARLGNDYVLCGLMSFGRFRSTVLQGKCPIEDDIPVGYTRVSSYIDWIYKNTMSSGCKPCIYNRPVGRGK